jgi:uncharacterized damage-inducible protein DinB
MGRQESELKKMKDFFIELFEYNYNCNGKLTEAFTTHPNEISERATKLYNHILNVHQVWNCRIEPNQAPLGAWDIHPLQELATLDGMNHQNSLLIFDKYDLNQSIEYRSTKGEPFNNSVKDILMHIINHSTYHRGQIATEFRQNGLEPVITDYIFYKRQ